jgi:hypothetical protein
MKHVGSRVLYIDCYEINYPCTYKRLRPNLTRYICDSIYTDMTIKRRYTVSILNVSVLSLNYFYCHDVVRLCLCGTDR